MRQNNRYNQPNQSYRVSPWVHQNTGYQYSSSPWMPYQNNSYRHDQRPGPRNDFTRPQGSRPYNKTNNFSKNKNKPVAQKRKFEENKSESTETASKKKRETSTETVQVGIEMVIVPSEFPTKVMTKDQLAVLYASILKAIDDVEEGSVYPQFLNAKRARGTLKVSCSDQDSVEWLRKTIDNLTPWDDCHLKLVGIKEMPVYVNVELKIPGSTEEPDKLLERLERQNQGLLTNTWHVISQKIDNKIQILVVSVDEKVIEALKRLDFKLFLNFSRIEVKQLEKFRPRVVEPSPKNESIGPSQTESTKDSNTDLSISKAEETADVSDETNIQSDNPGGKEPVKIEDEKKE